MDNPTDKLTAPSKLLSFLHLVLGTEKSHIFPTVRPSTTVAVESDGDGSLSDGEMSAYLEEVIVQCIADLPASEKVRRLLDVVVKNRALSNCFDDSVVQKVRNLLPSIVYRNVAKAVIEDAEIDDNVSTQTSTENVYTKGGDILLSFRADSSRFSSSDADWGDFLAACDEDVRRCVLRRLIRIGVADWKAFDASFNFRRPLYSGLELILISKHSAETIASLFKEDVEESKDKPASFFSCTEMGSLLSLNTMFEMKEKTNQTIPNDLMFLVADKLVSLSSTSYFPHEETNMKIQALHDALTRILFITKMVIGNILESADSNVQQTVLIWAAAVLNRNKAHSDSANYTRSNHNRFCSNTFLLNFAKVLLMSLTPFRQNQTKLSDLKYYSSNKCRLNLNGVKSLNGNLMETNDNSEENTNPSGRLNRDDLAEELFFLCQRAVGVCLIPNMFRCIRVENILGIKQKEATHPRNEAMMIECELYHQAVWDDSRCCLVAELFAEQAKLLHQMLRKTNTHENHVSPEFHRKMFWRLPEFLIVDLIHWIQYFSDSQLHSTRELKWRHTLLLENCANFYIDYLQCSQALSHPGLVVRVIKSLLDIATDRQHQTQTLQKLTKSFAHVFPSLVHTYASTYEIDGTPMQKGYFVMARGRYYISVLILKAWNIHDGRTCILAQSTSDIFREFMKAVFIEMLYMIQDFMSKKFLFSRLSNRLVKSNRENVYENHLLENDVSKVRYQLLELLSFVDGHLCLLQELTSEVTIMSVITEYPMSKEFASKIGMLLNAFSGPAIVECCEFLSSEPADKSKIFIWRMAEIILNLTRTELKKPGGFVEILTSDPQFDLKCMDVIECSETRLKENFAEPSNFFKSMKALFEDKLVKTKGHNFWMTESLHLPFDEEALLESHQSFLRDAQLSVGDLAQSHSFRYLLKDTIPTQERTIVLTKEMQYLQRMLHLNLAGTVFLIRDKARMDMLRCLLSGPTGTPYGRGLLVFDIFCTDGYPKEPPLVRCISAPYGAFIFGRCIRGDGRLCVKTLEAIIKGDDGDQRKGGEWSVLKVLNYIKKAMMTFNVLRSSQKAENSLSKSTGCAPGHTVCIVRAMTIRHAMLEPLRNPPPGLERVVRLHFATQRQALLKQCARWVKNCTDHDFAPSFAWTVDILHRELQVLDLASFSDDNSVRKTGEK